MKRVFIIILDSFGIGAAPDAKDFGDEGASTLGSIYKTGLLDIPTLTEMGLWSIEGTSLPKSDAAPTAAHGRLIELSRGKDTTTGHWEIAGIVSTSPMPTYPNGFPKEIISEFERLTGRAVICNKTYSGTEVIKDYGDEHLATGALIVYTSADSVFQIAAHESVVPPERLYEYCRIARRLLTEKNAVGRVIARPFTTENGKFVRTANRRDFSLTPPKPTMLDALAESGLDVISVGKINDIFAARGITEAIPSHSNTEGMEITASLLKRDFHGLAFTNLVDFDSQYGHRQDAVGYARALNEFDRALSDFIRGLGDGDALIITADHGCDPSDSSTDHTREYVPLLVYGKGIQPRQLGTVRGFGTVGKLVCDMLGVGFKPDAYETVYDKIRTAVPCERNEDKNEG